MKTNKTPLDKLFPVQPKTTYFDELPEEMQLVVADFLTAIKEHNQACVYTGDHIDFSEIDEIECRRRDGFIPHSWNKGGLQLSGILTLWDFFLGEFHLSGKAGKTIKQITDTNLEMAKETFIKNNASFLTENNLSEKDIDYDKLYKKGFGCIAELWSEYAHDNLNDTQDTTLHQVRVMYDGTGLWTVSVMHRISDAPYHRTCDDFRDFEFNANNVDELVKGLAKIYDKVIKAYL